MAFKLAVPAGKRRKLQQDTKLQAFAADEEDGNSTAAASSTNSITASTSAAAAADAHALKDRGSAHAEASEYAAALRCWEQALVVTPHDAALHEMRSQVLNEVGDAWGSVQAAARAVECAPEWADAHLTLARARHNLGEPVLALQSFDSALALMGRQAASAPDLQAELQQLRVLALAQQRHARTAAGAGVPGRAAVIAPEVHPDTPGTGSDAAEGTGVEKQVDDATAWQTAAQDRPTTDASTTNVTRTLGRQERVQMQQHNGGTGHSSDDDHAGSLNTKRQ